MAIFIYNHQIYNIKLYMKNVNILSFLLLTFINVFAQNKSDIGKYISQIPEYGFMENKGQIHDQNNKTNPEVKFLLCLSNGMNVQLRSHGFSYDTYRTEKKVREKDVAGGSMHPDEMSEEDITYFFHRVDVELVGANANPEIVAEEPMADYMNFYNAVTPERGAAFVRHYKKITYKNIYPGIDMVFVADSGKDKPVEYTFIVYPGADAGQIKLHYTGADRTELNGNKINIAVAHGSFTESIPASWIKETGEKMNVNYRNIEENIYGFDIPPYSPGQTLIIDPNPNLNWGTYYGGSNSDLGYGITCDVSGNVFITGYTYSSSGIATSGSHQVTFGGSSDAFVVKFNNSGVRQWGTYYGGSSWDYGRGITCDGGGNVFITGNTYSTSGIATSGSHQTIFGGGLYDAFIVKFNSSGVRQWGTYYGGSTTDYGRGIICDVYGNVLITGETNSTSGIATSGSHQITCGGSSDAFIVKFNSSGIRLWGTYYGGSSADAGYGVSCDASGNVLISGPTSSVLGIASSGAYQSTNGGNSDAFVAKFNSNGVRQWGTYFGGSNSDYARGITCDGSGNVFITGETTSTSGIAASGSHQVTFGGSSDAFVVKFNSSGVRQWGTYYGGSNSDYGSGITCDGNGNVFITGYTYSTSGIATSGSYQTAFGGIFYEDAFLTKFNSGGIRQWCTYYGGSVTDCGLGISCDISGNVFITGYTYSISGIATSGSQQSVLNGSCDALVAKFSTCGLYPGAAGTISGDYVFCQGKDTVLYTVPLIANATSYIWTLSDGATGTSTTNSITAIFDSAAISGYITVKGHNECGNGALSALYVGLPGAAEVITGDTIVCQGWNSVVYTVDPIPGADYYIWTLPAGATGTSATNSIFVSYDASAVSGIITVRGHNYCGDGMASELSVTVNPAPAVPIVGDIIHPSCAAQSVVELSNLPETPWMVTAYPGGTQISGDISMAQFTGLYGGNTYTFKVSLVSSGCSSDFSSPATLNTTPGAPAAPLVDSIIQPACTVATGSVILYGLPATGLWTINPGNITGSGTNATISGLTPGTYNFTVSDDVPCSSIPSVDVVINVQPGVLYNPFPTAASGTICAGSSTSLSASVSGSTIYWYSGSCGGTLIGTGSPIIVSPQTTSTFYARAYSPYCGFSDVCKSVTVTVIPVNTIILTAGGNQTKCISTPITTTTFATMGATGATVIGLPPGVTGNWAPNVLTISGIPTSIGTYTYTVTTTGGCGTAAATGTIIITAVAGPTATLNTVSGACVGNIIGEDVILNGFNTPVTAFQYTIRYDTNSLHYVSTTNWATGITGVGIQNPVYGSVGVLTFVWGDMPVSVSGVLCRLNFIYKAPPSGCQNLIWSDIPTPRLFADDNYDEISVSYIDGMICPNLPETIDGSTPICAGSSCIWTNADTGGTWTSSVPAVATVHPATGVVTGVAAGTSLITYAVTVSGCAKTATKALTITAPLAQTITGATPVCKGTSHTWTSTTSGGTWSSSDTAIASVGQLSGLVTGNSAGTAVITYSLANGGCVSTATKTLSITAPGALNITGPAAICTGASQMWTSTASGGTWSSSATPVATVSRSTGMVTGVSAGTARITYYLTVSGCANIATKTVTIHESPVAEAGADTTFSGIPVQIGDLSTGSGIINWSPAAGLSNPTLAQPLASPTVTTTYTLTVNNNGCIATDEVTVQYVNPTHSISGKTMYMGRAYNGSPAPNPPTYNPAIYTIDRVIVLLKTYSSGIELARDTSDASGNYQFTDVPDGDYLLSYDKFTADTMQWGNDVNVADVSMLKYLIASDTLLDPSRKYTADYMKAANVDNNLYINVIDVSRIKSKIASPYSANKNFPKGNWLSLDKIVTVSGSDVNINLETVCYGDYNASSSKYRDSATTWNGLKALPSGIIVVSDEYLTTTDPDYFEIPLRISTKMNEFSALGLELTYPSDGYKLVNVTIPKAVHKTGNLKINPTLEEIINEDNDLLVTDEDGTIRVVYATTAHFDVSEGEELINLGFRSLQPLTSGALEFKLSGTGLIANQYGIENEDAYLLMPRLFVRGRATEPGFEFTAHPNPFGGEATINYAIPENGNVKIIVYNALGELVSELVNGEQAGGSHTVLFSADNLPFGVYTFKMEYFGSDEAKCLILKLIH